MTYLILLSLVHLWATHYNYFQQLHLDSYSQLHRNFCILLDWLRLHFQLLSSVPLQWRTMLRICNTLLGPITNFTPRSRDRQDIGSSTNDKIMETCYIEELCSILVSLSWCERWSWSCIFFLKTASFQSSHDRVHRSALLSTYHYQCTLCINTLDSLSLSPSEEDPYL